MQKLFASDFDGTLHFHDDTDELISERDMAAIRAFQAEGGLFGVCTGRPLHGLTRQTGHQIPFDFYIAGTGSGIFDRDWNCLWRQDPPRDAVRELYLGLLKFVGGRADRVFVTAEDNYYFINDKPVHPLVSCAPTFDELPDPLSGGAIETDTVEEAEEAAAYVRATFPGVFDAFVNLASIDVVPAGCSKGAGLQRAAELFGADLTAGIGDSFNDLPLLAAADVSYTFHHVDESVRSAADVLVGSAAEAIADFSQR